MYEGQLKSRDGAATQKLGDCGPSFCFGSSKFVFSNVVGQIVLEGALLIDQRLSQPQNRVGEIHKRGDKMTSKLTRASPDAFMLLV